MRSTPVPSLIPTIIGLLFFFSSSFTLFGQSGTGIGWLPRINLAGNISSSVRLTGSVESRIMLREPGEVDGQSDLNHRLTDLIWFLSHRLGLRSTLAAGYTWRFMEGFDVQRFTLQYHFIQNVGQVRLAHRLAADHTIRREIMPVNRLRYRLVLEKSLAGTRIDRKEWYLKIGNEYLMNWTNGQTDMEIRIIPQIGFELTENNKIETGLDLRFSQIGSPDPVESNIWWSMAWFVNL